MDTENMAADRTVESELCKKETYPDICVCCGRPVPEGRMICWNCEHEFDEVGGFRVKGNRKMQEQ
ncbi:MAG: hypothetical protein LIP10_07595 [Clostridiales bacterium]|nr:hypothetical protein [Clostridiales bacterium]